ncbi:MAG: Fic family protein [Leptolyngbyaceae cyanobacterium]
MESLAQKDTKDFSGKEVISYPGPQTPNFGGFESCPPQNRGARGAFDRYSLFEKTLRLSEWEIRQIHSLLFMVIDRAEAGRYRQLDVKAAGTEYTYPPHYLVPELMAEFVKWLNSETAQQMHPIDYAAEAHCRFVEIHPFRDGNGWTGRLLMNLLLLRLGYPVVVISNERRGAYVEALMEARQRESLELFQKLILEAVQKSLVELLRVVVTAAESQHRGKDFYSEILTFLNISQT